VSHTEIGTPFRYVVEPIGWVIRIQPTIGRNTVDDDCAVSENAEEKIVVVGVEGIDDTLLPSRWMRATPQLHLDPFALSEADSASVSRRLTIAARHDAHAAFRPLEPPKD